jgi:Zn-dependent protease with chaperone function
MTREAFVARLEQLQLLAVANPRGYRWRVQAWALLGYGFILSLLLETLGALACIVFLMLNSMAMVVFTFTIALGLAIFAWRILRSLWVKFEVPKGQRLAPAEAAPLFALLRQQQQALKAPTVHQVLLTTEFNAAIVQQPRLGVLGWPRNYLMLGLPLLQALSPAQAAAVVAHELGHLRGGHGRYGAWVGRVSRSWTQLKERYEYNGGSTWLSRFTAWYVPRLNAWSYPLRRSAEFEAAAAAGRITSPQDIAQALCLLGVHEKVLTDLYWNPLRASKVAQPVPPPHAITQLLPVAKSARLDHAAETVLLNSLLAAQPEPFSTHPTLPERLAALGQAVKVPAPPTTSAAEAWLGPHLPALAADLDAAWATALADQWQLLHHLHCDQQQRLQHFNTRCDAGGILTEAEALEHAQLTEHQVSTAAALPLFQALCDCKRQRLAARFAVGRILLAQEDATGLALLDDVMARQPQYCTQGLALQQAYHQRCADHAEIRRLQTKILRHTDAVLAAQAESSALLTTDRFRAHGLSEEALADFLDGLGAHLSVLKHVWLLRKGLPRPAEYPVFVLVVEPLASYKVVGGLRTLSKQLVQSLTLPGDAIVVPVSVGSEWLAKRVRQWPATLVYKAS